MKKKYMTTSAENELLPFGIPNIFTTHRFMCRLNTFEMFVCKLTASIHVIIEHYFEQHVDDPVLYFRYRDSPNIVYCTSHCFHKSCFSLELYINTKNFANNEKKISCLPELGRSQSVLKI